jgi:hypothetical protein
MNIVLWLMMSLSLVGLLALLVWVLPISVLLPELGAWPLAGLLALTIGISVIAALSGMSALLRQREKTLRQVDRKRERLEVAAETAESQVKALEMKVQTLEKALENALKRRS